jgi:hypothetical protein
MTERDLIVFAFRERRVLPTQTSAVPHIARDVKRIVGRVLELPWPADVS